MTTVIHRIGKTISVAVLVTLATAVNAATVGTGPTVEFSKAGFADPGLEENQDRITPLVWLTRGDNQGLFNIAQEEAYQRFQGISPEGTLWAFTGLNGNDMNVSAENFDSLVFTDWTTALGLQQVGNVILDRPGVVHLVDDDIYLDIVFTEWGKGDSGGSFAYSRSSSVVLPVPAAFWLMASGLGLLGFLKRSSARRSA